MPTSLPKYHRIILKLSGEALAGGSGKIFDPGILKQLAREIKSVRTAGVEIGIVIGGGNIFRGAGSLGHSFDRVSADYMGMLATIINGLALQVHLEQAEVPARVQTAFPVQVVAEPFSSRRAIRHFEQGCVVIFAGGTGNPYFTTDTAAVLRAVEIEADAILKATQVDGVYSADPRTTPNARRIAEISYQEVVARGLRVMDLTAITMAMENRIPIAVFSLQPEGNLLRVVMGEPIASWVTEKAE